MNDSANRPSIIEAALRLIFDFLRQRFGSSIPSAALDAIIPVLIESLKPALHEADDRARAHIQASIDDALRKAGLI